MVQLVLCNGFEGPGRVGVINSHDGKDRAGKTAVGFQRRRGRSHIGVMPFVGYRMTDATLMGNNGSRMRHALLHQKFDLSSNGLPFGGTFGRHQTVGPRRRGHVDAVNAQKLRKTAIYVHLEVMQTPIHAGQHRACSLGPTPPHALPPGKRQRRITAAIPRLYRRDKSPVLWKNREHVGHMKSERSNARTEVNPRNLLRACYETGRPARRARHTSCPGARTKCQKRSRFGTNR